MTIEDEELIKDFIVESQEHLADVESQLLTLEMQQDGVDVALVNKVFRAVHSIKGAAGFLGYEVLESLAHRGEEVLNRLRNHEMRPTSLVINTLLKATDRLKGLLDGLETSNEQDVSEHIAALESLLRGEVDGDPQILASQEVAQTGIEPTASLPVMTPESVPTEGDSLSGHPQPAAGNAESEVAIPTPKKSADVNNSSTPDHAVSAGADSTIRVDVALLDTLMTRVGELVLARNQILQFTGELENSDLLRTTQRLNLITTELQEGVMKTRMQPIGNVWSKFPRLVRDLAAICGKEVRIEMQGKETELDKTIIEAIKDPLTHLVRNTVDHGIEPPADRIAKGKPSEGCLYLRAFHEGGQVNIEISDDGGGLNLDRIKSKAIEKGLVSQEQVTRMQEQEIAQLIFLPGFSTAEKVSNVSGRGVGMDVVKTNIEKIGGSVDLQTRPGIGTTIKIKIPLTLAIIPALIVTSAGNRFAIPQVNLLELVRLEGEQTLKNIEWIQGAPVYRLRGRLLPLVYLRQVLNVPADNQLPQDVINIVILRADDRQFGLVVDRISDTEEIVVKPLSKQLKGVSVYSGATIMGDGKVALILDVLGLAYASQVISKLRDRSLVDAHSGAKDKNGEQQTLLILETGSQRRLALPISQVARLEKISKTALEYADHQEVVQYRGQILPLIRLARLLGLDSTGPSDDGLLNVVVYIENDRSFGLVIDQIIDIVEMHLQINHPATRDGLLGSAVIHDRVTDLVDLPAIIQKASGPSPLPLPEHF
jgi:two-component system chemotaxis sensor kinase CheA